MIQKELIRTMLPGLLVGALLPCLSGVLTACIDEEVVAEAVMEDDVRAMVSSQFSLSLPPKGYATRQSDAIVQATDNSIAQFRGIEDIMLIPFASTSVTSTDHPIGYPPIITKLLKPEQQLVINTIPAGKLVSGNNSVLFGNVGLPTGTQSLLFYGHAIESEVTQADLPAGKILNDLTAAGLADAKKHKNGILTPNGLPLALTDTPSSLDFELEEIASDWATTAKTNDLIAYLNGIVAGLAADGILNVNNASVIDFLANYAASSSNVLTFVTNLYNGIAASNTNTRTAILDGLKDVTYDGGGAITACELIDDYANFPANLFLPDGAAVVEYVDVTEGVVTTKKFRAVTDGVSYSGLQIAPPHIYTYPTSLYYRGNSHIKTSKESQQDKYVDTNDWSAILGCYGNNAIEATTHSVVMETPVQYAVGRLDMSVKIANGDIHDYKEQVVAVPDAGFPVSAVLISSHHSVDFEFKAKNVPSCTVYDTAIGSVSAPREAYLAENSSTLNTTKTLVLQTMSTKDITDLTATPYHKVYVVVEFVNNLGTSFVGQDAQIIPDGCHFYLIGELDPTQLSGYDIDDPVKSRVFTQDYITTANFTINSLAEAYNIIPDLRVSELELGLRIDTNWQVGNHFTDTPIEFHQ